MRLIPKNTKVKLAFYKGIQIVDILIAFIGLFILALTLSSNLPNRFYIALGILCLFVPLFISFSGERVYQSIGYIFKYIASRKKYQKKASKEDANVEGLIPYKEITQGMIENKDGTFLKVLEVYPVDFRLLSLERQNDYIENVFSRVLNQTSSSIKINLVKLERPLILDGALQDELDRINDLIKVKETGSLTEQEFQIRMQVIEDRINIIDEINSKEEEYYSRYYLCFLGKSKQDVEEITSRSKRIFQNAKIQASILKDMELKAFIRYSFDSHFDERTLTEDTPLEELIPKEIYFKLTSTKLNNQTITHFVINHYPLKVGNAWAEGLFDMPNTKVVMKLDPVDKYKSIKRIDNSLFEIKTSMKGKVSEQMDKQTHIETLEDLLQGIQTDNEMLFDTTLMIAVYDEANKNTNKRYVRSRLKEMGFHASEMIGRQMDGFISSSICMLDKTNIQRGIPTTTIAASFPFVSSALIEKKGIYIGDNRLPVFLDFFKRDDRHVNSNMVIIGKSGSGKSYATKTILTHLASIDTKVYMLDPENEYGALTKNFKGTSIDVSNGNLGKINPFQMMTGLEEDDSNTFYTHLQFLEEFYRLILKGINADSLELLNKITQELYESKKINASTNLSKLKPKDYPTFEDLNELVESKLAKESDEYNRQCLKIITNYISKFKEGGRNSTLWNGHSSFQIKENFVTFNFQKLLANKNDTTANAQMLLVLKWLENEVIKNRDYNIKHNTHRKIVVGIDEAHLFIDDKYPIALDFMYQLAKRIRKYDGMLIIITQNVKDFTGTLELARKSMAIINVSQYSMIFSLSPNDMSDLCDLYQSAGSINETERDYIINNQMGRAFLISSPSERTNIDIHASEYVENLFN